MTGMVILRVGGVMYELGWYCTTPLVVYEELEYERNIKMIHDKNVRDVINKMAQRSELGLGKYGVTTERTDLTEVDWLIHAQEEAMDLAIYLTKLINEKRGKENV